MRSSTSNPDQASLLPPDLLEQLDARHPLLRLAARFPWGYFDTEFAALYSEKGRPAKPIRLMIGLLLLKQMNNFSDETVIQHWAENPFFQLFCGERYYCWRAPCDASELTYFRKRIGVEGVEKLFAASVALHGDAIKLEEVCSDTTVQEKNVTYPTDAKQYRKIIAHCLRIARNEKIKLSRTYAKEIKALKLELRFANQPKNAKKARRARGRLKTIAGRMLREIQRRLSAEPLAQYEADCKLYQRMLNQKRGDKNKLYSLHEPHIYCMSKGKEHKKYEFGTKASVTVTRDSKIIVGALAFEENKYDGHTLPGVISQLARLLNFEPDVMLCDRGYRGVKKINKTKIMCPSTPGKDSDPKLQALMQKRFRKRAGIEPIIGHLKSDYRLGRNFLKGFMGDQVNLLMAAAAFNLRKWMRLFFWFLKLGAAFR